MSTFLSRAADHVSSLARRAGINESVITGLNPVEYDATNPITVFIIQIVIILLFTQGLGYVFSFAKQPKVIAEVVGGVILGPTVMGRIPNFSDAIFPKPSMSNLNLVANVGLVLFLFLIGVEVDPQVMRKNGRNAAIISLVGMVLPFGLGAAVAVPIYNRYVDSEVTSFGHFLLFVGVAMAITAFPVLCRILTATKLLENRVGVIVLAAGVGNDVVGWVLLALTLALVNSKSGASAVYILLAAVGWSIFLLWPVKKAFRWLVRRTGSQNGPSPLMMVATFVMIFTSAFFTGIIGVHPIFGGFLAGLVVPHQGGFAISLVEKIDDLVTFLFLPIYFVLSGLNTNMGLLNTGEIWGYIILLIVVGWAGKFVGCGGAAYLLKYSWRESGAIGMLMSCKGLVELIVLNVGLSAGIINAELFSAFVVVALVLTFITTPFTLLFYPERHRLKDPDAARDAENANSAPATVGGSGGREHTSRLLVVLQKIEHLAPVMLLSQMLEPLPTHQSKPPVENLRSVIKDKKFDDGDISDESLKTVPSNDPTHAPVVQGPSVALPAVHIDALKLIELTGRMHSVMQSAEKDEIMRTDDTLQLFKQFGRLRGLHVNPHIAVVEEMQYPESVSQYASDLGSELVLIPWTVPSQIEDAEIQREGVTPFDNIFAQQAGSPIYTHFVRRVFNEAKSDTALFVDRGFGSTFTPGINQHIFLPFFGGRDDRLALRFVVQLCHNPNVTATVVYHQTQTHEDDVSVDKEVTSEIIQAHQNALHSNQLSMGPSSAAIKENAGRFQFDSADDIAWSHFTSPNVSPPRSSATAAALHRITFATTKSASPLTQAHHYAEAACESMNGSSQTQVWRSMLIVTGRGRKGAVVNHENEIAALLASKGRDPSVGAELRKTVGDVGTAMMLGGGLPAAASFLVLESGK